jgi:predicted nuclease with TOPRIM domain
MSDGSLPMSATQSWIKEQFENERKPGVNIEYTNMRLTAESEQMKDRIKRLETDMAFLIKEKNEE